MATQNNPEEAQALSNQVDTSVVALLAEWFKLKDEDKAIRKVRNEYMQTHRCLNVDRPTTDFANQSDYEDNGGECIYRQVGMGGYPAPLCEVCQQRNEWFTQRQALSQRRAQIMRKLKRQVQVIDMISERPDTNSRPSESPEGSRLTSKEESET